MRTHHVLIEQIKKEKCVLFLGNELPIGFPDSAPPSQQELSDFLAEKLELKDKNRLHLSLVAQHFEATFGRQELIQNLINVVNRPQFDPPELYQQIAALPFRTILVTGYDSLLELALQKAGKKYTTIVTGIDTPYIDDDQTVIYYLNGHISRKESLVLTPKDQVLTRQRAQSVFDLLRFYFQTRSILFLQYGLDINGQEFQRLFHEVTHNIAHHRRQAFAVWQNPDPLVVKAWEAENLLVLDESPQSLLSELSIQLAQSKLNNSTKEHTATLQTISKPPYKFLDYYNEEDKDIFFGREQEINHLWRKLFSGTITVVFGPSGAGKTSLLNAGIIPRLREENLIPLVINRFDDICLALKNTIEKWLLQTGRRTPSSTLPLSAYLQSSLTETDEIVFIIDSFEEFFRYQGLETRNKFWLQLGDLQMLANTISEDKRSLNIRFILTLREDYLPHLAESRDFGLNLFENSYRVLQFDLDKATLAIMEPAQLANLFIEHQVLQRLLEDLEENGTIAPPHLQIVCNRLYQTCFYSQSSEKSNQLAKEEKIISLDNYVSLGGAKGILTDYLEFAIGKMPSILQEIAKGILKVLISSQSKKVSLSENQILQSVVELGLLRADNSKDLALFQDARFHLQSEHLIRGVEFDGTVVYELAHDSMATHVQTWMTERDISVKLAHELLSRELESWQYLQKPIEQRSLKLIFENRFDLKNLSATELELLLRSAIEAHLDGSYWARRAYDIGVPVIKIANDYLDHSDFHLRMSAIQAIQQIGEDASPLLIKALPDSFPKVRVLAIQTLANLATQNSLKIFQENLQFECFIPEGAFIMGVDLPVNNLLTSNLMESFNLEVSLSEQPSQKIILDGYIIDKYPVTNADYAIFLEDNPGYPSPPYWKEGSYPKDADKLPVTHVSWHDANSYANWAGKRLPTEAEWEKAARGEDARLYPWGGKFSAELCNTAENKISKVTPVDLHSPSGDSPYGLADMCGNVWEWTADWYRMDYYSQRSVDTNPPGPSSGTEKVLRGGSFRSYRDRARTFCRFAQKPDLRNAEFGFRCALSIYRKGILNEQCP